MQQFLIESSTMSLVGGIHWGAARHRRGEDA